jgi:hypothetical protein
MTRRRIAGAIVALALVTHPQSANANPFRCDGSTRTNAVEVWCEHRSVTPGNNTPNPAIHRVDLAYHPVAFPCVQDGFLAFVRHLQRVTPDGKVVSDRSYCPIPPGPRSIPAARLAAAVHDQVSIAGPSIGVVPSARALVGVPIGLFATGPLIADVVVRIDGAVARGTATAIAWSWEADHQYVASSRVSGSARQPALKYIWSTSGTRAFRVVVSWMAVVTVTYPDGTTEDRDLPDFDLDATRRLTVEQMQAQITYEH